MEHEPTTTISHEPRWKPLSAIPRRILGVLVEKAKTTPDNYPMSLNALTTGCNQKSNRDPVINLTADQVEEGLDELRVMGAVAEVHGDGRVVRYRHYMKDWLGVDGTELAVMTELMLRGTQTVGELRMRAARMAPDQLPDLASLEPVLQALMAKKLVVAVTPRGRGQLVTHGLYLSTEMDRVLKEGARLAETATESGDRDARVDARSAESASRPVRPPNEPATQIVARAPSASPTSEVAMIGALRQEIAELRDELARVKKDVADLWSSLS